MKTIPTEFYGDNTRWFVGRVIDNTPPAGLEGRVKVRVFGVHSPLTSDIPQRDLPWAQVMNPSTSYGVSGLGTSTQILPGALVFGLFLDGINSQLPMIMGSLPNIEFPTSVQAASRQDLSTNPFAYFFDQSSSNVQDPVPTENVWENDWVTKPMIFFIDNGMNIKQASSMIACILSVSRWDPTSPGGIASYPIESARYSRFINYAQRFRPQKDFNSLDVQLMYIMTELHTTKKLAYSKLLMSKEIKGNIYGSHVDGIDIRGNGMVGILKKYFFHPDTAFETPAFVSEEGFTTIEYLEDTAMDVLNSAEYGLS
jgi:hypothetical protein|tara:strand:+ start:7927 stop:8862 length:936 start_codon:yes stop_codon:yes gene_type:complete